MFTTSSKQPLSALASRTMFVFCFYVFLVCFTSHLAKAGGSELERLIRNVEANERLFQDIDIVVRQNYVHIGMAAGGAGHRPTKESQQQIRYVRQRTKERVDVTSHVIPFTGEPTRREKFLAYDGDKTRILSGRTGNIRNGYYGSPDWVEPHMMLLSSAKYKFPLSTYLRGSDAIRSSPHGAEWPKDREVTVDLLSDEILDGRSCARVHIVNSTNIGWILWLDRERNYLPVKRQGFTHRYSTSIPTGDAMVLRWKEYEPGIWIPELVELIVYDQLIVMREERQEPLWKREIVIESVDLDPDYPDEYFTNVTFPEGTLIHHVSADGKVLSSEIATSEL